MDAKLVVTWGTSVTRGIAGTLANVDDDRFLHEIPVVFMIVADPIGAGIIRSYARTGRPNVTGTRNRVPEMVNINTIRSYYPKFRRLGMLYNANERNSVLKVEELRGLSKEMDFDLVALEHPGNKARCGPHHPVGAKDPLGDERGFLRLDTHSAEGRLVRTQRPRRPDQRSARAEPCHQHVDPTVGVTPEFLGRRAGMRLGIGGMVVLANVEGRQLFRDALGFLARCLGATLGRRH